MSFLCSKCPKVFHLMHKARILTLATSPLWFDSLYFSHFFCCAPPTQSAPSMLVSVLFLRHAKHPSASGPLHLLCSHTGPEIHTFSPLFRALLQCHPFSEGFPDLIPPPLPPFPILAPALLFPKALITTSKTTHVLLVCCLPLPLACKLHEDRGLCLFHFDTLFLVPRTVPAHSGCSVNIVGWMSEV